jgi:hypothetical protein
MCDLHMLPFGWVHHRSIQIINVHEQLDLQHIVLCLIIWFLLILTYMMHDGNITTIHMIQTGDTGWPSLYVRWPLLLVAPHCIVWAIVICSITADALIRMRLPEPYPIIAFSQ